MSGGVDFSESFWGDKDEGFGVVLQRLKHGKQTAKEILELVMNLAATEEEMSKKLVKIAKSLSGKDETGTLKEAFDALHNGIDQTAQAHAKLAVEIRAQIEKPLSELIKEQTAQRKAQEKTVERAVKTKVAQITLVGRTRKNYEGKMKEADQAAEAAQKGGVPPKDLEKLQARSKRASSLAENADLEYKNSVEKLHELTSDWETIHRTACQCFQQMEEQRIENLKNFLWALMKLLSTTAVGNDEYYRGVNEVIQKIDIQNDLSSFVQEKSTGTIPPAKLTYEPVRRVVPHLSSGMSSNNLNPAPASPMEEEPRKPTPATQFPPSTNQALFYVKVLYDYDPQGDEELALQEGEIVPVVSMEEDPWWEGEKEGRTGMFPSNFVAKV